MADFAYHHLGVDLLNQADVDNLRAATPPPMTVTGISFTEVRTRRTEPALHRPKDTDHPKVHVRFLDAHLAMGKRIYQVARDVFFKDIVMFRTEGHRQAKEFEGWCKEMSNIIKHLERILRDEFVPFARGQRARPPNYFFYLGFRWHYLKPDDMHTCTRIVRVIKRYIFDEFRFSSTDRQKAIRFRMNAIIQAQSERDLSNYDTPYLAAPTAPWHGLSPPVAFREHRDDGETFVPEAEDGRGSSVETPSSLSLVDLSTVLQLARKDAVEGPPAVVGGERDRVSACKTKQKSSHLCRLVTKC